MYDLITKLIIIIIIVVMLIIEFTLLLLLTLRALQPSGQLQRQQNKFKQTKGITKPQRKMHRER